MITKHQLLHLNAIIKECDESKLESIENRDNLSASKNIAIKDYDAYLTNVKQSSQIIIKSGVFPALKKASDIHDYLEKNG